MRSIWALASIGAATAELVLSAHADEMSGSDKLRLLYSHRFSFTREGLPLVTVEIMDGQSKVALSAEGGVRVLPQGDGGPEVIAGPAWTITVEQPRPAKLRHWIIVGHGADDAALATWKQRGYEPKT